MKSSFGARGPTGCLVGILAVKESMKQPEKYVQDGTKREHSERVSQTRQCEVAPSMSYILQVSS